MAAINSRPSLKLVESAAASEDDDSPVAEEFSQIDQTGDGGGGGDLPQDGFEALNRETLVHNEQTKIRATYINTVAAGFIIAGVVTPIVAATKGDAPVASFTLVIVVLWFLLAAALHYGAGRVLELLR